ncbi:MAG: hypothetical protein DRN30_05985 [Thermoplasmata archaeon]|nr:MAG: hypothetical protein DRN30_05985 [Thermoplasmata archaeon]
MGFSEIAVAAVLFSTILLIGISLGAAYFNYLDEVDEAKKVNNEILYSKLNTCLVILNATYYTSNSTLVLIFENEGDTVLNLDLVNIFLDGILVGNVTDFTYSVNDRSDTKLAFQGDLVNVIIPYERVPSRVMIVSDSGVKTISSVSAQ